MTLPIAVKRALVEPDNTAIPVNRQCELLGLNRATYYYQSAGESAENVMLMRKIDEQYTRTPFYGVRRMTAWLRREGETVNHKRVARLMQTMGIHAIYPHPKTSVAAPEHRIYPYLLRGLPITRVNQVWSTDITYVRLQHGFIYVTAVLDWFSRYVLSWAVSNTLDVHFCLDALDAALRQATPEIFNTDQGAQFTSHVFTQRLSDAGVRISMDGRGRAFDNIFVERLWRSLKYEEVYLAEYDSMATATTGIGRYFRFYNTERLHQALDYVPPLTLFRASAIH